MCPLYARVPEAEVRGPAYKRPFFHLFGLMGVFTGIAGLAIVVYLSVGWLFGQWIGSRPLFMLGALLVIAGIQLVSFGLLAEMIVYGANRDMDPPIDLVLK